MRRLGSSGGSSSQHLEGHGPMASVVAQLKDQASGGEAPLKLKHFWYLDVHWKLQICLIFYNLEPQKIEYLLCLQTKNWANAHETRESL